MSTFSSSSPQQKNPSTPTTSSDSTSTSTSTPIIPTPTLTPTPTSTTTAPTCKPVPIPTVPIISTIIHPPVPENPPEKRQTPPQRSPSISAPISIDPSNNKSSSRLLLQTQLSLPSTPQSASQLSSPSSTSSSTAKGLRRMGSVKKQPFFMNLRIQLIDQLKSLDTRLETQCQLTNEIQEFFKKRAEVEMETSRALEKLAKNLNTRHKEIKAKRDSSSATSTLTTGNPLSTPLLSSSLSQSLSQAQNQSLQPWTVFNSQSSLSVCWQQLINDTKIQSQNHAILADIYSTEVTQRLQFVSEDLQRIYKQCREIGLEAHEELLKVLHELHTSMKTYHTYQTETRIAEAKLKLVEAQRSKLEQQIPKEKLEKSKKMKLVEKEVQKRMHKFTDARFKSQKAKNEYILCMDAANAAVQKYFMEDLSDLIDCMDLGFYECVTRSLNMYVSSQDQIRKSLQQNMENMSKCISSLDARLDKQKFLESHNTVFALPKKFEFVGPSYPSNKNTASIAEEDFTPDPPEIETSGFIRQELEQRLFQLHKRLETLRMESDELWKTLETAENSLLEMITAKDYDTCAFFIERNNRVTTSNEGANKMRSDKQETDEFHLNKFRDYMLTMNRISRLQSKYEHIRRTLKSTDPTGALPPTTGVGSSASTSAAAIAASTRQYNRRKRIGQIQKFTNTRLFGGSIEEYLEKTNQEIPLVMKSCIRVINLYGLQHQGIFRVSGSQVEINNFKESFEKGEDPLADVNDASDINSVAGVFKLYLRELREPLFPICYFEQFMELAQLDSNQIFISRMRDLVKSLPRAVFIVLRYLFAFLNHLSEYSDENMMDPYNLAICFGPTLVPVPEDKDQVQYQNLVNELIKNVILFHDEIFVDIMDGVFYEKYISTNEEPGGGDDAGGGESGPKHGIGESSPVLKKSLSCVGSAQRTGHSREDSSCSSVTSGGRCEDGRASVMSEEAKNNINKNSNSPPAISTSPLPNPPNSPVIKETVILNDDLDEDDEGEGISLNVFQKKSEFLEAIAQFDFSARSTRELSLKKGETLVLYAQVSSDWWKGANRRGDEGLIPDKYILLKIRDEDMPQQQLQTQPPPPQQHTATTPSSNTVPPPLATPPQNQSATLSEISIAQPTKSSSRSRTASDSLLTTPVQKSSPNTNGSSEQNCHTRSFSVSDDRAHANATNNKVHQNGVSKENDKSEIVRKPQQSVAPQKEKSPSPQPIHQQLSQKQGDELAVPSTSTQPEQPSGDPPQTSSPLVVVKSNIQFWEQRLSTKPSQSQSASAAPDLVMGLPTQAQGQPQQQQQQAPVPPKFTDTSPSSSDESDSSSESTNSSASSSPSTPTRVGGSSGAEVFAKQKNATLKKRTQGDAPPGVGVSGGGSQPGSTIVQTGSWSEHHQRNVNPPGMFTFSSTFNKPQVKVKPVVLSKPKLPREFSGSLNKMDEEEHGGGDNNGDDGEENLSIEK